MLDAAARILEARPDARFLVPLVSRATRDAFEAQHRGGRDALPLTLLYGHAGDALRAADVALVASGTATLEAALARCPHVIFYRVSALTARIVRRKLLLPYVGLPNVLAGRFVVPELLQDDATPGNLAQAALNLFDDTVTRRRLEAVFGGSATRSPSTPARWRRTRCWPSSTGRTRRPAAVTRWAAHVLIAGVDEAGRGPLAGPVVAAAVILDPRAVRGLRDSKVLTPEQRTHVAAEIRAKAIAWAVAASDVDEIDTLNILRATLLAMRRAVEALAVPPIEALVDGDHCPQLPCPAHAIVKGDRDVPAISAASILAKTARDAMLVQLDREYPQYGFAQHKGYGTPEHLAALDRHGPCPAHRRSFAPVRAVVVRVLVNATRERPSESGSVFVTRNMTGIRGQGMACRTCKLPRQRRIARLDAPRSLELIRQLVRFDTTSRRSNLALIDWVREYLGSHGIASRLTHDDDTTKANLFATIGDPRRRASCSPGTPTSCRSTARRGRSIPGPAW